MDTGLCKTLKEPDILIGAESSFVAIPPYFQMTEDRKQKLDGGLHIQIESADFLSVVCHMLSVISPLLKLEVHLSTKLVVQTTNSQRKEASTMMSQDFFICVVEVFPKRTPM